MEKAKAAGIGFAYSVVMDALSRLRGQILTGWLPRKRRFGARSFALGGTESILSREIGSSPNNPYAMYTPGRYVRGC